MPARLIAHLDMDAFYASVELLRYPELKGLPVVIGGGRDHGPATLADGTRRFARPYGYQVLRKQLYFKVFSHLLVLRVPCWRTT